MKVSDEFWGSLKKYFSSLAELFRLGTEQLFKRIASRALSLIVLSIVFVSAGVWLSFAYANLLGRWLDPDISQAVVALTLFGGGFLFQRRMKESDVKYFESREAIFSKFVAESSLEKKELLHQLQLAQEGIALTTVHLKEAAQTAVNPLHRVKSFVTQHPESTVIGTFCLGIYLGLNRNHNQKFKQEIRNET